MRLGQKARAHEIADFFFEHQRPKEWRQWAEVVWRDPETPKFIGDMPHTWVASDFVRSALDFFGYERAADSSYVLGAGVIPEWLTGDGLRVRGVGTHYGTLDLRRVHRGDQITAAVQGLRMPPGGVLLRPPAGQRFVQVTGDGTLAGDGSVRLTRLPANVQAAVSPDGPRR